MTSPIARDVSVRSTPSIGLGECAVHATSSRNFRFELRCPLVTQRDRATQVQLRHHLSRKQLQCQLLTLGNALRPRFGIQHAHRSEGEAGGGG